MNGLKELRAAKPNQIVPLYEEVQSDGNAIEYFMKLSDYGRKKNSIFLESADVITKYGEKSIGSASPCINVIGKGDSFTITALNPLGKRLFPIILQKLKGSSSLEQKGNLISGTIKKSKGFMSESQRLLAKTQADVLRAVAFCLEPAYKPFPVYAGLMGAIGYDFIDQFERLPKNRGDVLKEPDFEMNFYDSLFIFDHRKKTATFVANAFILDEMDRASEEQRCKRIISEYKETFAKKIPLPKRSGGEPKMPKASTDTSRAEFVKIVQKMKKHILKGDVFQVVPSRTIIVEHFAQPLDIYSALRELNPSPYMFFFNNSNGVLLGSSPEMFIKVSGNTPKQVEIRPIAGTKPRGIGADGKIDPDLDSRFEAELKNDPKEMAEHTMLIDLARNDVARVSKPGSRHCDRPYMIEKYSHVQHLVSNVTGELRDEYDAMHAYLASMNMGTLTGAPKVEAMKLIRLAEKNRRGFYGGSIGYLTPSGEFDSAIVIRSMSIRGKKAYIRAGAGIVFDSDPNAEFDETEKKARAALRAIELAEGFK
ncbi:MAG: anthranilate synthase component 1 [archaeon]|nr:anthranilate synthase component 1 [archaeon]